MIKPTLAVVCFVGSLLLPACQVAFGDFEIDTRSLAVSCLPNTTRCEGAQIETCLSGTEWHVLHTCDNADSCNLVTLSCTPCQPGSTRCNEAVPQRCGADLKWTSAAPCVSAALCVVPEDGSGATCAPPGCPAPAQLRCADEHLQRCPVTQTEWQDVEVCASPALCDLAAANARVAAGKFATCVLPACSAGQFNCDTGSPRPCNAARTGWDSATTSCAPGSLCNPQTGDCSPCSAGSFSCSGPELYQCNSQQVWLRAAACSSTLSCDAVGAAPSCQPASCEPGAFQCSLSALERCRSDGGGWELVEQCQNGVLCQPEATRCEPPQCAAGAQRCRENQPQHCREDLTGWENLPPCAASERCDAVAGCVQAG